MKQSMIKPARAAILMFSFLVGLAGVARAADEGDARERDHRGLRLTPETGKAYTSCYLGGGPSP